MPPLNSSWQPEFPQSNKPLHEALADEIEAAIDAGRLRAGERLPTHRDLAKQLRVGLGTITRAYAAARERGLVAGEVGRGTYVLSSTAAGVSEDVRGSLPNRRDFADALRSALERIARRPRLSDTLADAMPQGSIRSREAGVEWLRRCGLPSRPDHVLAAAGIRHAILSVLTAILEPGDTVLCEAFTWSGMPTFARTLGFRLQPVEMDSEGMLPDSLDRACKEYRPKAVHFMPYLQIPTCSVMSDGRREEIAAVCRRHDLWMIEDDPCIRMLAGAVKPIGTLFPERSIYVSDASSALHPGIRTTYVRLPDALADAVYRSAAVMLAPYPLLDHEIYSLWIEDGTAERLLAVRIKDNRHRQSLARERLRGLSMQCHENDSEMWVELPPHADPKEISAAANECGLRVLPGSEFALIPGLGERHILVHLGGVSHERLVTGLDAAAARMGESNR